MNELLAQANGLTMEDFKPKAQVETEERLSEIEDAIIEIAELIAEVANG